MSKTKDSLPHQGRWMHAKEKRFRETILFVHHFGGNRASVKRHQDFVAELGFDSVAFTLSFPWRPKLLNRGLLKDLQPGLRSRWQREVGEMLDALSGEKILYTFSFPSAPAIMSVSERGSRDVKAWVADGGPFLQPFTCFWNYYRKVEPTPLLWRPSRMALGALSLGMLDLAPQLHRALNELPRDFPVLSIRAWQDELVPISAIDEAFSGNNQLRLETLTLPEAGHIDGLQKFPQEYKPRVVRFLEQHASPLTGVDSRARSTSNVSLSS